MTGYEAFEIYQALKLHFTSKDYNFFTYNGKINTSINAFDNRKDKYHFHKLSRKYTDKQDLIDFVVANLLISDRLWVGDLLSEDADVRYKTRQKVLQSLSYVFENDCKILFEGQNPNDILKVSDGDYPVLLRKSLRHEIQIETVCLLNKILNFIPKWDKQIVDTIRWPNYQKKLIKYAAFLPQDTVKYKLLLKKVLND